MIFVIFKVKLKTRAKIFLWKSLLFCFQQPQYSFPASEEKIVNIIKFLRVFYVRITVRKPVWFKVQGLREVLKAPT